MKNLNESRLDNAVIVSDAVYTIGDFDEVILSTRSATGTQSTKIKSGDLLSARLRRIAASSSEVANEIVAVYLVMEYKVNKCYGVWGVSA